MATFTDSPLARDGRDAPDGTPPPRPVGSVPELIAIAAAAGGARGRARIALQLDAEQTGSGCPPDGWPLLVAIARRLVAAGRIELV